MYNQSRKSGHPHLKPVVGILSVGVLSGHVEPIHLRGHVLDLVVTVHHAQSCCQLQHSRSPQHHFPSVVCWPVSAQSSFVMFTDWVRLVLNLIFSCILSQMDE